jgi:UDP-N-acetyl-D-mannosaminuronate dehydrogenase
MLAQAYEKRFSRKISGKSLVVGVIGLGYSGSPQILACAEAGFNAFGLDVGQAMTESLGVLAPAVVKA